MVETEEECLARQRKEDRDLVSQSTSMKKQANKKTRKRVNKEIKEMEEEMKKRHADELAEARGEKKETVEDTYEVTPEMLLSKMSIKADESEKMPEQTPPAATHHKKRNRQKERLARRDAAFKAEQEKAAKEAEEMPDLREIEMRNINELCQVKGLTVCEITPDGHCLFASIADQLKQRQQLEMSVQDLRHKAAEYIREDPDTFVPFLFDEKTMSLKDVGEYTKELETSPMWGGDLEILALSKVFDCPISVMMSGRQALVMNEEGSQPELKVVYYQHSFGLGEHYNSLRDEQPVIEEDDGFVEVQ